MMALDMFSATTTGGTNNTPAKDVSPKAVDNKSSSATLFKDTLKNNSRTDVQNSRTQVTSKKPQKKNVTNDSIETLKGKKALENKGSDSKNAISELTDNNTNKEMLDSAKQVALKDDKALAEIDGNDTCKDNISDLYVLNSDEELFELQTSDFELCEEVIDVQNTMQAQKLVLNSLEVVSDLENADVAINQNYVCDLDNESIQNLDVAQANTNTLGCSLTGVDNEILSKEPQNTVSSKASGTPVINESEMTKVATLGPSVAVIDGDTLLNADVSNNVVANTVSEANGFTIQQGSLKQSLAEVSDLRQENDTAENPQKEQAVASSTSTKITNDSASTDVEWVGSAKSGVHVTFTSMKAPVTDGEVLDKAKEAGLKVISSYDSEAVTNDVLQAQAGSTLSLLVKMQNAVRDNRISDGDTSFMAQILRKTNINAEGAKEEGKISVIENVEMVSSDNLIEGVALDVTNNISFDGQDVTFSTILNQESTIESNDVFGGLVSNVESRAAMLSGSADKGNIMNTTSAFTQNGLSNTNATGDIFGRVELFGGDNKGNAERIHEQVMKMAARNLRQVELELYPRSLGRLKIAISVEDGHRAQVNFATSSKVAKELLDDSMPKLKEYMSKVGIDSLEQTVADSSNFSDKQEGESALYQRAREAWHQSIYGSHSSNTVLSSILGQANDSLDGVKISNI